MSNQTKVGILALVVLALGAYLVLRVENLTEGRRLGWRYVVVLPNAQGLEEKSPVLMQGIRVGRVIGLRLEGERVEVDIVVEREKAVREGARATVGSVGLLGEKQLDLRPGPAGNPVLPPGSRIPASVSPSLDEVIAQVGRISGDLKEVTGAVRESLGGPKGTERINTLIDRLNGVLDSMDQLLRANRVDARETIRELRRLSSSASSLMASLSRNAAGEGVGGSGEIPRPDPAEVGARLRRSIDNLDDILGQVRSGQGAMGRLVFSEETAERVDQTLDTLQGTAERVTTPLAALGQTRLSLGLRGDYLAASQSPRLAVGADVLPPRGLLRLEAVSRERPGADPSERELLATAMLGYRGQWWGARAGLLESRPGIGADLFPLERLRLSAEAWDVPRAGLWPHTRVEGALGLGAGVWLVGGVDDLLNGEEERRSFFLGASLRFPDAPSGSTPLAPGTSPAARGEGEK